MMGRYGPYVQIGEEPEGKGKKKPKPKRASVPKGINMEDVTLESALKWLSLPRDLGVNPATGGHVQTNLGRYGPYVVDESGDAKDYRSLKKGDDVYTITLERALELLAEPKKGRRSSSTKTATPLRERRCPQPP